MIMYLLRMPRWARMEAGQIKGHQFSIVASRINISRTVPSSLYVTQGIPSMIAKNQVFSTNFFHVYSLWVNACLAWCLNKFLIMKVL